MVDKLLINELINEIREEIKEEAEVFIIAKCKEAYKRLLMTGPFSTKEGSYDGADQSMERKRDNIAALSDNEIVKDRERNIVMGAIMH